MVSLPITAFSRPCTKSNLIFIEACILHMVSKQATIINEYGIHCRPSAVIAQAAREKTDCTITVETEDGRQAHPTNILQLIGLSIPKDETVTITVEGGEDEEAICQEMVDLFETNFDFKR
jgi:phosphotransferase system HPr (HPr) family protein